MLEGNEHVGGWIVGEARTEGVKRPRSIKGEARIEGAKCPRIEGEAESRAKPELERGRGLGRGSVSPFPKNFWKFLLETVQSGVQLKPKSNFSQWRTRFQSQPNSAMCLVFGRVVDYTVGSVAKLQLPTILMHLKRMHYISVALQKNVRDGPNINHSSDFTTRISEEGSNLWVSEKGLMSHQHKIGYIKTR